MGEGVNAMAHAHAFVESSDSDPVELQQPDDVEMDQKATSIVFRV